MTNNPRPLKAAESKAVGVTDIGREISEFWRDFAEESSGKQITRVCTISLMVYTEDEESLPTTESIVAVAADEHPLRGIYLLANKESETDGTQGQVSGFCRLEAAGDLQICCEQLVIAASGRAVQELPNSALALLVPDLPVALWWTGQPPFGTEFFERLESLSDKLIVDSLDFSDQSVGLRESASYASKHPHSGLGDLNWLRLTAWREVIADLFDDPAHLPYLKKIDLLDIEYVAGETRKPAQAIMMAGWIASRLGWNALKGADNPPEEEFTATASNAANRTIKVNIRPVARESQTGNISAIRIEADGGKAKFSVVRTESGKALDVSAEVEGIEPCRSSSVSESLATGKLLAQELEVISADEVYYESLIAGLDLLTYAPGAEQLGKTIW